MQSGGRLHGSRSSKQQRPRARTGVSRSAGVSTGGESGDRRVRVEFHRMKSFRKSIQRRISSKRMNPVEARGKAADSASSEEEMNKRLSQRDSFDRAGMSLDEKLKARSRTSLRKSGTDFIRAPVGW